MTTTILRSAVEDTGGFAVLLKTWRRKRRRSQLDLALTTGVSQRHLSFLESGRARPSRSMILQLSETLEVPLRDRNDWLIAGGFAPVFRARTLDDPQMAQIMGAIRMMLSNHEPFPAVAVDRAWNIRLSNRSFEQMSRLLNADLWSQIGGQRNLMRLFFHPRGLKPFVANWAQIAPMLWRRAEREAAALDGQEMREVLNDLRPSVDLATLLQAGEAALVPVLPLDFEKDGVRISVFGVISTFGTAQDITADELRIECLFPADAQTEALFRAFDAPDKEEAS